MFTYSIVLAVSLSAAILITTSSMCAVVKSAEKSPEWVDYLTAYVTDKITVRQTVLLFNKTSLDYSKIEKIVKQITINLKGILLIDVAKLIDSPFEEQVLTLPEFLNPRSSSLFVILKCERDMELFNFTLDFLTDLSPDRIRPRCLVILEKSSSIERLRSMMTYAWTKKILDLTILELSSDTWLISHFNPFSNTLSRKRYVSGDNFFPDKLADMKRYSLKVALAEFRPGVIFNFNSSGYPTSMFGKDINTMKILSKSLNFQTIYVPSLEEYEDYKKTHMWSSTEAQKMLDGNNNINLLAFKTIRFPGNDNNNSLEVRNVVDIDEVTALVPVLPSDDKKSSNYYYFVILFVLVVAVDMIISTCVLNIEDHHLTIFHTFRMLIGQPVPHIANTFALRVIVGSLLAVAFMFSSTIFAAITSSGLEREEMSFDTMEDLVNSRLTLWVPNIFANQTFPEEIPPILHKIKENSQIYVGDVWQCPEMLREGKHVACLIPQSLGNMIVEVYKRIDGKQRMKLMKPYFWIGRRSFALEKGSPYSEKFDHVLRRIEESDLINIFHRTVTGDRNDTAWEKKEKKFGFTVNLLQHLVSILIGGYSVSLFVFIIELTLHENSHFHIPSLIQKLTF